MTSLKNSQDNLYNINLKIKFRLNMVDLSPLSQKKVVHEDQIIHCVSKKTLIIGFVIGGDHHLQKKNRDEEHHHAVFGRFKAFNFTVWWGVVCLYPLQGRRLALQDG